MCVPVVSVRRFVTHALCYLKELECEAISVPLPALSVNGHLLMLSVVIPGHMKQSCSNKVMSTI